MKQLKDSKKLKVDNGKDFQLSHYPSDDLLNYKDETSLKNALNAYKESISDLQEMLYA
jgi:hypothetical protein